MWSMPVTLGGGMTIENWPFLPCSGLNKPFSSQNWYQRFSSVGV
jgi:hypothetical protein